LLERALEETPDKIRLIGVTERSEGIALVWCLLALSNKYLSFIESFIIDSCLQRPFLLKETGETLGSPISIITRRLNKGKVPS
jgi:hypothetical protein